MAPTTSEPGERTSDLAIFPLSNVVLFPRVQVPLYIFEPRYRQMTRVALAGDRRIGMVVVEPAHIGEMRGNPPVFAVGCEGEIRSSQANDDGTYHILLLGTRRFRILEEHEASGDRLYRLARVEELPEEQAAGDAIAEGRARVLELVRRMMPDRADRLRSEQFERVDGATFVNAFCQSLDLPVREKQQLLEANGVRSRLEQLVALLEFRVAERTALAPPGSETVH